MPPPGPNGKPFAGESQDPRAREEEHRHDRRRQERVADTCGELEETLEQLRTRYELYFVGVERREPAREREEMRRAIGRIKGETGLNTGLRFRIDTLHARFLSYERMWTRTAREKEEGTYRRDLQRLRRRPGASEPAPAKAAKKKESRGAAPPESASERTEGTPTTPAGEAVSTAAVAPAPSAPPPAPTSPPRAAPPPAAPRTVPPAGAGGLSADQLQALYAAYVDAKKRCHEDVSRITYEALASTVARQVPELIQRYKAKSVEFRVLIKDGKALLKAVPRT